MRFTRNLSVGERSSPAEVGERLRARTSPGTGSPPAIHSSFNVHRRDHARMWSSRCISGLGFTRASYCPGSWCATAPVGRAWRPSAYPASPHPPRWWVPSSFEHAFSVDHRRGGPEPGMPGDLSASPETDSGDWPRAIAAIDYAASTMDEEACPRHQVPPTPPQVTPVPR